MYTIFKYNLARESLRQIVKKYHIKTMYIPYYLCDSVRHTLVEEKCKPVFYHIDDNFMPVCEFSTNDYILYPNYFGIFSNNVNELASLYPKLIVDNAHAFFDKPKGFACFNSAYKFGLGNFSYLWMQSDTESNIIEQKFEQEKNTRRNKFLELDKIYSSNNLLKINKSSIPFCYPYLAENITEADNLVNELTRNGYTIYRYWTPLPRSYNEYKFYSRLVPIPI